MSNNEWILFLIIEATLVVALVINQIAIRKNGKH
jgi:hypothetical protein